MMATRRPIKCTKEDLAHSIIQDDEFDSYRSSALFKYYRAFGQIWRITYTRNFTVKSIEQVDENLRRIGF